MSNPTDIRQALQDVKIFIMYRLEPQPDGKLEKIPTNPTTGRNCSPHSVDEWMWAADAQLWADVYNNQPLPPGVTGYGIGVVISEHVILPNGRRLFCLDIDKCRDGAAWAPHATAFLARLPGCGCEVSVSINGLHGWGTYSGERPDHGTRNKTYGLELYTRLRFVALGSSAVGDPLKDLTQELNALCRDYFPPHDSHDYGGDLTTAPVPEWKGPTDDDELIHRALNSKSARVAFAGHASLRDLWEANESRLSHAFPPQQHGTYDASAADQAMANHWAFWTGNHGERIERIMRMSGLARDKWERPGYLRNTIQRACGSQKRWYTERAERELDYIAPEVAVSFPGPRIGDVPPSPTGPGIASDCVKPKPYVPPAPAQDVHPLSAAPGDTTIPPAPHPRPPIGSHLFVPEMAKMFEGCVYVQDVHEIFMPAGYTLDPQRFNAEFGGYTFTLSQEGDRPERKAWDAFVHSEVCAFPKVRGLYFDPKSPPRHIRSKEGMSFINSYSPIVIPRHSGDVAPFLDHLRKLLPLGNDAHILLCYFAACVQYIGEKFQWWPLIQGVEGNGKTTLSHFVEYAIGERYTHWPKAAELGAKFNSAFYGKILICCEDVHINDKRGSLWESLKPMITGSKMEIEAKGVDKVTREICFNGIMNSNHKNAIRKSRSDRRIGPFFCAQQSEADLTRDYMDEAYFRRLRDWRIKFGGSEIVADFLYSYQIPDELNPAGGMTRCPKTTATVEAIEQGQGVAEQEILEAVAQGLPGFRGGWISSSALDRLLAGIGKGATIPRNRRRELLEGIGYEVHPGLPEGRMTVLDTDGTRPVLFVKSGTASDLEASSPATATALYQAVQRG